MKPFLKWAGGKRWLVNRHPELFSMQFKRYIEPFVGGGAVFFHLDPKKSVLGDLNPKLITTYQALKDDHNKVYEVLLDHASRHSDLYYYNIRSQQFTCPYKTAAQFLYLNRTCWNGLYRENLKGIFNVPRGTKNRVIFPDDDFAEIARRLKTATLKLGDFEPILKSARSGDLFFVDPPYTVKHNQNGFIKYNEKLFSWEDQLRLVACLKLAKKAGANIIVTNANHPSVIEQYEGIGRIFTGERKSVLSSNSLHRGDTSESIILIGKDWKKHFQSIEKANGALGYPLTSFLLHSA